MKCLVVIVMIGLYGCGDSREQQKRLTERLEANCKTILLSKSDDEVVQAYQDLCQARDEAAKTNHPNLDIFDFEMQRKKEFADKSEQRIIQRDQSKRQGEKELVWCLIDS
jgi:hypothetical protein